MKSWAAAVIAIAGGGRASLHASSAAKRVDPDESGTTLFFGAETDEEIAGFEAMIINKAWLVRCVVSTLAAMSGSAVASAQSVPTIDTEDATLGSATTAGHGRVHPMLAFDGRNGDFARGNYDDDRADLNRLPVHAQVGVAIDLWHGGDGQPVGWLVLRSSNGFHAPAVREATAPRAWYESNTLAALVFTPAKGLRAAAVYTVKASPNGVSATTHEASLSFAYDGDDAVGSLAPTFAVTTRSKGASGVYTQVGIEPGFALGSGDGAAKVSTPLAVGVGWRGFYGRNCKDRMFASAGAALEQPFSLGSTHATMRWEALALIRDNRLAALSGPDGETATVVPLVTWSVSVAY
jgi:hypothetical protein